jgi:hypothetical protein
MAIHPRLGRRCGIGPDVAGIAVRQVEGEVVRLLFDTTDKNQCFAKISLGMTRGMLQRHKHLATTALMLAHVILDDRISRGRPTSSPSHPSMISVNPSSFGRLIGAVRRYPGGLE